MVVYILYCKADFENISSLTLKKSGVEFCFSVRNTEDVNEVREKIVVDTEFLEESSIPTHEKHRVDAPSHFSMKWDHATTRSTLRVLGTESKILPGDENEKDKRTKPKKVQTNKEIEKALGIVKDSIHGDESGNFVPLLALDCYGLEPYAFHPMGEEFSAVHRDGAKFEKVDLSEGDWSEYDISHGSVSITNFESKFE